MRERWATFDCYGTLIDWEGGIRAALHDLWPEADAGALLDRYHEIEPLMQEGRDLPYREVMALVLEQLAAQTGLELRPERREALAESLPQWPAFPDVPPALQELRRRGWRLGILSNVDPDLLSTSLGKLGAPVDLTITVAEAGSYKPAYGHWRQFFDRTQAGLSRQVHVAQSLYHDIAPCFRLGLTAVWINRRDEKSDLPRAAELPNLERLPEVLERLVPPV